MSPEWLRTYRPTSEKLMAYGWFLPTYLLGKDMDRVQKLCDRIDAKPPADQADRQRIEDEIYYTMLDIVFHPNWRARAVCLGMRLPHFKEFSHIYESGIFAYYKREYAGCILLLLCALEGVLRLFSGLPNPTFNQLIGCIRNSTPRNILEAHSMYSATLADFLEKWIYKKTTSNDADFSLSVLNRHYVMHGLSSGEFYRPQDVHRLVLAFDLLVDFISVDAGIYDGPFISSPGENATFDRRREYFESLSEGNYTIKQSWKTERALLKEHSRYVAPRLSEPDILQSQVIGMLDHMSMLQKAGKGLRQEV